MNPGFGIGKYFPPDSALAKIAAPVILRNSMDCLRDESVLTSQGHLQNACALTLSREAFCFCSGHEDLHPGGTQNLRVFLGSYYLFTGSDWFIFLDTPG